MGATWQSFPTHGLGTLLAAYDYVRNDTILYYFPCPLKNYTTTAELFCGKTVCGAMSSLGSRAPTKGRVVVDTPHHLTGQNGLANGFN